MTNGITATCMKVEFVIVVGSEDNYDGPQRHNKMMFMQNAVLYVRKYQQSFDRTTVFYFKGKCANPKVSPEGGTYYADGYTSGQVTAMKNAVTPFKAVVKEAGSWAHVSSPTNNTEDCIDGCGKHVQVLVFFYHGWVNAGIWLNSSNGEFLTPASLGPVTDNAFLPKEYLTGRIYRSIHVTSWACQTANHGVSTQTHEQNIAGSLAQKMANAWDVKVRASATQTNYSKVFDGGLSNYFDGDRRMVDGVLWEDDGANRNVYSGTYPEYVQSGMWKIEPDRTSGYRRGSFD